MSMPMPFTEQEAELGRLLVEETKHEQRWFFWFAMACYLIAALISFTNPQMPVRTGNVVELWINSLINILLVPLGLLAYWYSRQPRRIYDRLQQLVHVRPATRTQAILTLIGAFVLLLSSGGSPTFILIASLAFFFGGLQWRWVRVSEMFTRVRSEQSQRA